MKKLMRVSALGFVFVLVASTVLISACEKDSTDGDKEKEKGFTDFSIADQVEMAEAVAENGVSSIGSVRGMTDMMENGDFADLPYFFVGGLLGVTSEHAPVDRSLASPPDTIWTGPDAQGWYEWSDTTGEEASFLALLFRIRLTPDIWAAGNEGLPITTTEMEFSLVLSDQLFGSYTVSGDMANTINTERTLVSGSGTMSMVLESVSDMEESTEFSTSVGWTDVAVDPNDYSGDYDVDLTVVFTDPGNVGPIISSTVELQFSSAFAFEADGSGTGNSAVDGEEVIRFFFDAATSSQRTGYFTLASEDFETQHPFSIDTF